MNILRRKKKEAEKNDVPRRIIEFMKENYSDPDFYMTTLVEEFGLSDKTIAKLIKGHLAKRAPELTGKGIQLAAGFKNLRLPGKLKALGLLASPLAAGGIVDAAVD